MYRSIIPRKHLQPFIESIWLQEGPHDSAWERRQPTRVLPTASVEASFFYADPFLELSQNQKSLVPQSIITGQKTRYKEYLATGKTGIIIVRFKPWGAQPFFGVPLYEFVDKNIDLKLIVEPELVRNVEDRLQTRLTSAERVDIIQDCLEGLFTGNVMDKVMLKAAQEIGYSNGTASITQIAKIYSMSVRQFERRFKQAVGISPKKFSSIVRLQKTIAGHSWNEALEIGDYYDQAHYIKIFKSLTGLTPGTFYNRKSSTTLAKFFNSSQDMSLFYNTIYL